MQSPFSVKSAELLQLQSPGRERLVLGRRVIATLALRTSQCDKFSWHLSPDSRCRPPPHRGAAEPGQRLLRVRLSKPKSSQPFRRRPCGHLRG